MKDARFYDSYGEGSSLLHTEGEYLFTLNFEDAYTVTRLTSVEVALSLLPERRCLWRSKGQGNAAD